MIRFTPEEKDEAKFATSDYYESSEEPNYCSVCNGSGEGMYDGTTCMYCKGKGILKIKEDHDERI